MKVFYVKTDDTGRHTPGLVLRTFGDDHQFTEKEIDPDDNRPYNMTFGVWQTDTLTDDDIALCNAGRRKVNDVENPTGVESIG